MFPSYIFNGVGWDRVGILNTLLPYNSGALLIRIGELRVNSVKFDDNKDGKSKSKVLGLYLAY